MEEGSSKKISKALIAVVVILVAIAAVGGYVYMGIQPRAATPAVVSSAALAETGWSQSDAAPGMSSISYEISSFELVINSATMNYTDPNLPNTINSYASALGLSVNVPSSISSTLMVVRVVPPSIADLVGDKLVDTLKGMLAGMYVNTISSAGVGDFKKTGTMQLDVGGKSVTADVYEGSISAMGFSGKAKGILAVWQSDYGVIAAAGIVPSGIITYTSSLGIPLDIDLGDDDFNNLKMMVESIS